MNAAAIGQAYVRTLISLLEPTCPPSYVRARYTRDIPVPPCPDVIRSSPCNSFCVYTSRDSTALYRHAASAMTTAQSCYAASPMEITWKHPNNWRVRGFRDDMNRVKNSAAQTDGIALCDAMAAWRNGDAPPPDLALAVAALKHDSMILTPMVEAALGLILEDDPEATAKLRDILSRTPARSRGMLVFHFAHNKAFTSQQIAPLVDDALADRSSVVRVWAVDALLKVDPSRGPARLKTMRQTEKHKQVLRAIGFALDQPH